MPWLFEQVPGYCSLVLWFAKEVGFCPKKIPVIRVFPTIALYPREVPLGHSGLPTGHFFTQITVPYTEKITGNE